MIVPTDPIPFGYVNRGIENESITTFNTFYNRDGDAAVLFTKADLLTPADKATTFYNQKFLNQGVIEPVNGIDAMNNVINRNQFEDDLNMRLHETVYPISDLNAVVANDDGVDAMDVNGTVPYSMRKANKLENNFVVNSLYHSIPAAIETADLQTNTDRNNWVSQDTMMRPFVTTRTKNVRGKITNDKPYNGFTHILALKQKNAIEKS